MILRNNLNTAKFAALFKAQQLLGYRALSNYLSGVFGECPNQAIVLSGHSLGAWIVNDWLRKNRPNPNEGPGEVDGVVLTGDPQFRQEAASGKSKSKHRPRPILGIAARLGSSVNPYPVQGWSDRTRSFCLQGDPVCGKGFVSLTTEVAAAATCQTLRCPHLKYWKEAQATQAGEFLRKMILNGPGV